MAIAAVQNSATDAVVDYIFSTKLADVPIAVVHEAKRAFINIVGCAVGGCRHPSVEKLWAALSPFAGQPQATVLGRTVRTDAMFASLVNCLSSCVFTYDDAHAEAVVHPSGPVVCALLSLAETESVSGEDFMTAFLLGVEFTCRLSKAVSVAPAKGNIAWSQTGIAGGIGAAIAVGKVLKLDRRALGGAIAIALTQASGVRVVQGTAASGLMPAQAAPAGLRAALLARQGLATPPNALEGKFGFADVFAQVANIAALTDDLGSQFEIERLTYKPYPTGIVIGPIIDACLALRKTYPEDARQIEEVLIKVNPVTLTLTDRRHPVDALAAQVSLYHWAAVAFLNGSATLAALDEVVLQDPRIRNLRDRIKVTTDPSIAADAAEVTIRARNGREHHHRIEHGVGSVSRPMTDEDLRRKFRELCGPHLGAERAERLLTASNALTDLSDVGLLARMAG
ncbi:MAG: MmgE/PrpD family protein [Pseudolabrys sp.]